jgi:hypothetical protein
LLFLLVPPGEAIRTDLTMISKVLQVVANGSDIKEEKLRPIEAFVKEYQNQISQFLTCICVREIIGPKLSQQLLII